MSNFILIGQGNFIFFREKAEKSQGILEIDVCDNHVTDASND